MTCDGDIQKEHITKRNFQKIIDIDKAIFINKQINQINSDFEIDTALVTLQIIADMVLKYIVSGIAVQ